MITIFKSKIVKGNKNLTGFTRIPKDKLHHIRIGETIKVAIAINKNTENFYGNIRDYSGMGFYIHKKIVKKHSLIGKSAIFKITKEKGFASKIGSDGRIYIPTNTAKANKIRNKDIISITENINRNYLKKFSQVHIRKKKANNEYKTNFNSKFSGEKRIFEIENLTQKNKNRKYPLNILKILRDFNFAQIENNKIIVFYGNRIPIIINQNIKPKDIMHYLGCYFADGTKKGNSWAICASTFEQARYYHRMHRVLVENPQLNLNVSYTCTKKTPIEALDPYLREIWEEEIGIKINENKLRIRYSDSKNLRKHNKYGTLIIREHKELLRIFYTRLLDHSVNLILNNKSKIDAINFICGVLEGDGCANAKGRGHIQISTNRKEKEILEKILPIANFKCGIRKEGENKYRINIGTIEIIKNIKLLKNKLFINYPKRRKVLIERLSQTSYAKYITGERSSTSPWSRHLLKMAGILDSSYNLTTKGKIIKRCLISMKKEIRQFK